MSNQLVDAQTGEIVDMGKPLTAKDIQAQVNLIQEVMASVMQDGQHYGLIPGCGKKPTLLKPGAEKLSMVFKLRPIIKENGQDIQITNMEGGHKDITVYCHVFNMAGIELATGVGSCSTMENKYRYRGGEKIGTGQPVPKEYWNLSKAGKKKEAQATLGGEGFGASKIDGVWQICAVGEKAENPDIADVYNTVLKMAKKRAYVDGILSATGASDIFTQDIEDMPAGSVKPTPDNKASDPAAKTEPAKPYKEMNAAFDGKCEHCKKPMKKGDAIVYHNEKKKAYHPDCFFDSHPDMKPAGTSKVDEAGDAQE